MTLQSLRIALFLLFLSACVGDARPVAEIPQSTPLLFLNPGGHSGRINQLAFTPDGCYLVSVGDDKIIRFWNLATNEVRTLHGQIGSGPVGRINAVAISTEGKTIAVGGVFDDRVTQPTHRGDVRVYDISTGRIIRVLRGHELGVISLSFTPDGKTLVSASGDQTIRVWSLATGDAQVLRGHEGYVYGVALSPDGKQAVSASADGTVRTWDLFSGAEIRQAHHAKAWCVAWSPDGRTIASGGHDTIRLWDASTGKLLRDPMKQDALIASLAFAPNGNLLSGIAGVDGAKFIAQVWSVPEGTKLREFRKHTDSIASVTYSRDGRYAATADNLGVAYVWDATTTKVVHSFAGSGNKLGAVGWSSDGKRVAWGKDPRRKTSLLFGAKKLKPNNDAALQYSFDLTNGTPGPPVSGGDWHKFETKRAGREVTATDGDRGVIVRGGGAEVRIIQNEQRATDLVHCFTLTPSGEVVVGSVFTLALYDASRHRLKEFVGHQDEVWAVSVSPDGKYLASASADSTVKIWRLSDPGPRVEPLLNIFVGSDREWVAWTREGYYASSPLGDRMIGWQVNHGDDHAAEAFTAYQFRDQFYRPDIVSKLFAVADGNVTQAIQIADQVRPEKTDPVLVVQNIPKFRPPTVELLYPDEGQEFDQPVITVRARVRDPGGRKLRIELLVNGDLSTPDMKGTKTLRVKNEPDNDVFSFPARLIPGDNVIAVFVKNDARSESEPVTRHVIYKPRVIVDARPTLRLVAVGVSLYKYDRKYAPEIGRSMNLQLAAKDAHDFAEFYQSQRGKLFKDVIVHEFANEKATHDAIIRELDWLRAEATPVDYSIFFVSGHGVGGPRNNYFFLPHDGELDEKLLEKSAVKWTDFHERLNETQGFKLLILDTCHAAGAAGARVPGELNSRQYNGVLHDTGQKSAGYVTMAACRENQLSLENPKWGNGAFTKALLEGLRGDADIKKTGFVDLFAAESFLYDKVPEITRPEDQMPAVHKPITVNPKQKLTQVR